MDNIFDTHAHYDDRAFDADRLTLLDSLPGQGIRAVINCGTNEQSSRESAQLSRLFGFVYFACGIHPHDAGQAVPLKKNAAMLELAADGKCAAIGEIGLDYHYQYSDRDVQLVFFEEQLALARELRKPVIIHDREAHAGTLNLLKKYKPAGVMHCFSGSAEFAAEVLRLGMYIGLGGAVTFRNAKKPLEAARATPLERLLLETDCPYMAPEPLRGKRCDSAMIPYAAQKIADAKGIGAQTLIDITTENACRLFGISLG